MAAKVAVTKAEVVGFVPLQPYLQPQHFTFPIGPRNRICAFTWRHQASVWCLLVLPFTPAVTFAAGTLKVGEENPCFKLNILGAFPMPSSQSTNLLHTSTFTHWAVAAMQASGCRAFFLPSLACAAAASAGAGVESRIRIWSWTCWATLYNLIFEGHFNHI